jgi:hypothetical protein
MPPKMTKEEIEQALPGFYGTEAYHKWSILFPYVLTDGAQFLAENAGAFWLMDVIASYQREKKFKDEPFQVWRLTVKDGKGEVVADDGNDNVLARQRIPFTDFPLDSIKLYFIDGVVLLPGEY